MLQYLGYKLETLRTNLGQTNLRFIFSIVNFLHFLNAGNPNQSCVFSCRNQYFHRYDIILDAAGLPESEFPAYLSLLKDWRLAKYITLRSPLLRNTDQMGLVGGMLRNAADLVIPNLTLGALLRGVSLRWGYFAPINAGVREISRLAENGQVNGCFL